MSVWIKAGRDPPPGILLAVDWEVIRSDAMDVHWMIRTPEIERRASRARERAQDEGSDLVAAYQEYLHILDVARVKRQDEEIKAGKEFSAALQELKKETARSSFRDALALELKHEHWLAEEFTRKLIHATNRFNLVVDPAQARYLTTKVLAFLPSILDPPAGQYLIYRKDEDRWLLTDDPAEARMAVKEVAEDAQKLYEEMVSRLERQNLAAEKGAIVARFDPGKTFRGRRRVRVRRHARRYWSGAIDKEILK